MKPRQPRHQPRQKPRLKPAWNKETTPTTPTRAHTRMELNTAHTNGTRAPRAHVCVCRGYRGLSGFKGLEDFCRGLWRGFSSSWRGFEVNHG